MSLIVGSGRFVSRRIDHDILSTDPKRLFHILSVLESIGAQVESSQLQGKLGPVRTDREVPVRT